MKHRQQKIMMYGYYSFWKIIIYVTHKQPLESSQLEGCQRDTGSSRHIPSLFRQFLTLPSLSVNLPKRILTEKPKLSRHH